MKNYNPDEQTLVQLATNRKGKFTTGQKAVVITAALVTTVGLIFMSFLLIAFIGATVNGVGAGGPIGILFLFVFALTFIYLVGTLYANVQMFLPDALARKPVKQARGKLEIRMAQRERDLLPFSYIVDGYSFAPFMVPPEVPMQKGRTYAVYYAASSRMFLGIELIDE